MTVADPSLTTLALRLARLSAGELDLPAELGQLCEALPQALGVAATIVMVTEPSDEEPMVAASDAQAGWMGEAQRRSGTGPLPAAIRSGRPLHTPDITRLGPPELAAVAAETGRRSSVVVPLRSRSAKFGALQLLGDERRAVHLQDAEAARTVVEVLVARLVDVRALRLLAVPRPRPATPVDPGDVVTEELPQVPVPDRAAPMVPAPRRPPARHRRADSSR